MVVKTSAAHQRKSRNRGLSGSLFPPVREPLAVNRLYLKKAYCVASPDTHSRDRFASRMAGV